MGNSYRFLDDTLKPETRERCKQHIDESIRDQAISCHCDDLKVIVNFNDPTKVSCAAMVRCGCGHLKSVTFHFSLA